jgi:hypothetical protein
MRVGDNPHKIQRKGLINTHQVIIPVYIPHEEGYFKDSFQLLRLSITSLRKTTHNATTITIADNGSSAKVIAEIDNMLRAGLIDEVIHSPNIGKLNAILKGLAGGESKLVTIADADVLFLPGWQQATTAIFKDFPKAGVVGIVPQIRMWEYCTFNVIFDNLCNGKLSFMPVPDVLAMKNFYHSIGWEDNVNPDYYKYLLAVKGNRVNAFVGSGHFVATYSRDLFERLPRHLGYKLGGNSEAFLDHVTLEKDYWRLTTLHNFAYHMGNQILPWMEEKVAAIAQYEDNVVEVVATNRIKIGLLPYAIKNRLFPLFYKKFYRLFLKRWKLPADAVSNFHQFVR